MKTVVLIGDSIRKGYQSIVQSELKGGADVWAPEENCRNSHNVLAGLDAWAISRQPDLIHINCGLHDLKKESGQSHHAVPIEEYEKNVRQILDLLRAKTTATLIWASTTNVNEKWHHDNKGFDRSTADVNAYNAVATRVASEFDLPINPLFKVSEEAQRSKFQKPDGVHFTPEGYTQLGKAVAQFIKRYL